MKIYVAGPFFNKKETYELGHMITLIRSMFAENVELFIPMEHEIPGGWDLPNSIWAKKVFDMDVRAIDESDMIIAMYTGHYSDTGTVWEMGYAHSKGIPVIGYIPDWAETEDMSLMVLNCFDGILTNDPLHGPSIETLSSETLKKYNHK